MQEILDKFAAGFYISFIKDNRWKYLTDGLQNTLIITFFSLILGAVIGFVIAYIRVTNHNTGRFKFLNSVSKGYLSVIRGTPVVIQLMVISFVLLTTLHKIPAAIVAFGINSGAYVSEIFRSGILSIDLGQMEAGRSLGLSYRQTMWKIIMPQAIKTVLPTLGNECIVLTKETSVAGYIAVQDLTKGADIIRSRTYEAFFPLMAAGLIYFLVIKFMEIGLSKLERRLRRSDRR